MNTTVIERRRRRRHSAEFKAEAVAARLRYIAATEWGKRRYLNMEALLNPAKQEERAAA